LSFRLGPPRGVENIDVKSTRRDMRNSRTCLI
jgi:hypothetical protein